MDLNARIKFRLVNHSAFDRAARFLQAIDSSPPGTISFVVGASGAGKSELSLLLGRMIYGRDIPDRMVPFIRVEARNPENGFFSSKSLVSSMLRELKDPFSVDRSFADQLPSDLAKVVAATRFATARPSEGTMRVALARLARRVQCRLLLIDEGNILTLNKGSRPAESHLEAIRTLAHDMEVRVVILGTLRLLSVIGYSAQIDRISTVTLLDRFKDESEYAAFLESVETDVGLEGRLLMDRFNEIRDATYGIPGQLRDLLDAARRHAFADRANRINWSHIRAAMPFAAVKNRMRTEADLVQKVAFGEELSREDDALLEALGLK